MTSMIWDLWGDGKREAHLPRGARTIAKTLLKGTPHPVPRRDPASVILSTPRLDDADLDALSAARRHPDAVDTADATRLRHLCG